MTSRKKQTNPNSFTKKQPNVQDMAKQKAFTLFKNKAQLLAHSLGTVVAFINSATVNRIAALHASIADDYERIEKDDSEMYAYLKEIYNIFGLMGHSHLNKKNEPERQFNICKIDPTTKKGTVSDAFLYNLLFSLTEKKNTNVFVSYGMAPMSAASAASAASETGVKTQVITGLSILIDAEVMERSKDSKKILCWKKIVAIDKLSDADIQQVNSFYENDTLADLAVICATPKTTALSHRGQNVALPLLLQSLSKIASMKRRNNFKYNGIIVEASAIKDFIPAQRLLKMCGFSKIQINMHPLLKEVEDMPGAPRTENEFNMDVSKTKPEHYFVLFDRGGKKWFEQINVLDTVNTSLCPHIKHDSWKKYPYCM